MDKLTLVIGNKNYSSWSLRPWLLLRYFNVPFAEIRIPLSQPETRGKILEYSPAQRVPVLLDESLTVWDSLAICEYVSEQYLDGRGWPQATAARAQARSVAAEMHAGFSALRTHWPMNIRLARQLDADEAVLQDIERIQLIWEGCLGNSGGPWLFGEFGIADAMFAPVVLRFNSYEPELRIEPADYVQTMLSNEALMDWMTAGRAETEVIREVEVGYLRGEPGWE